MTRTTPALLIATLLALSLHVASAQAQLVRTCVSMAKGNDANSASFCHCTVPCRTFATAAANTLPDGEITVLDPGDYGGLTITRSISINNDSGGEASISVQGGTTGIIINGNSGAYVNLRGITIQGVGFGGGNGLVFNTGFSLTMTNCVVRNHSGSAGLGNGVLFQPNASANLAVSNTLIADNGQRGLRVIATGAGTVKASFSRVELYQNNNQALVITNTGTGTVSAVVEDSVSDNNFNDGFAVNSVPGAGPASLMVIRSVSSNNASGLFVAGANATLRIGQSTLTGNTANSWVASAGGLLRSYGDNNIDGNADGDPVIPTILAKK
jgi:hypothetical protein